MALFMRGVALGHVRLGRLAKTHRWREVVELLDDAPRDTAGVASAIAYAAESRLRELKDDPSLTHCFWLLTRIATSSRGSSFVDDMASLGLTVDDSTPTLGFVSQVTDSVRRTTLRWRTSGNFAELASLALRRSLTDTVGEQGPGLFTSSAQDLQQAFRRYSTKHQFGALSRRFFGDFLARTLLSSVDRELPQHLRGDVPRIAESADFKRSLDLFARQSAKIVEEFAGAWYSKHNWESKGEISQDEAQKFVAVALRKLRMELKLSAV